MELTVFIAAQDSVADTPILKIKDGENLIWNQVNVRSEVKQIFGHLFLILP